MFEIHLETFELKYFRLLLTIVLVQSHESFDEQDIWQWMYFLD